MICQTNIWKWTTIGLIGKKSCKKQKKNYSKEKAAEYYQKSRECYKNMSQEEKDKIKESNIYIYIYIYIYISRIGSI